MEATSFTDLPLDVLLLIAPYLSAHDFLALISTCHHFYDSDELRFSSTFWSRLARYTFRVPNQPVAEADGRRWMRLYRRMHTQSRIFNWGKNDGGCFGGVTMSQQQGPARIRGFRGSRVGFQSRLLPNVQPVGASWPRMSPISDVGIVADLQCGGWSTVMLNSKGCLYINGKVSDLPGRYQHPTVGPPKLLSYPPGYTPPTEREDPNTAIEHFSAGRCHVLGLSDNGRLWTWSNANHHAMQVKFLAIDTHERSNDSTSGPSSDGLVTKVRAGFSRSSAYIHGKGIVVWEPVENESIIQGRAEGDSHAPTVVESVTIPNTGYVRPTGNKKDDDSDIGSKVGEVRNWVVLGEFILFITDLDRVFAVLLPSGDQHVTEPFQVLTNPADTSAKPDASELQQQAPAADVQGSHERFAIILRDGQVVTGDQDALTDMYTGRSSATLKRIPSLQHTGVISLAFGDYHFLALHADGNITSHGKEPGSLGALGLGYSDVFFMRGIQGLRTGMGEDGELLPECETTGRRVFFDQAKYRWLWNLGEEHHVAAFTANPARPIHSATASEWAEQKLRAWDSEVLRKDADKDEDGLNPYFALSVAAGGWHSGAIVLVSDDEKKQAARQGKEEPKRAPPQPEVENQPGTAGQQPPWPAKPASEPCFNCTLNDTFCDGSQPICEACRTDNREPSMTCAYPEPKDWWDDTLPPLRMPNGELLPGDGPAPEWTCPEFKTW